MKLLRLLPCLTVLLLVSCTTENFPDSAVDTLPFSIEEHKDRSVHPGDVFYKYCLGSWLSSTPMPEGKQPDVHNAEPGSGKKTNDYATETIRIRPCAA